MEIDADPTRAASHPARPTGSAFRRRDLLLLVVFLVAVGALAAVLIHAKPAPTVLGATSVKTSSYAGFALNPAKPAPALKLKNYLGVPVDIADYRGKAVLVTFLYTHCPDVCPIITSKLHTALAEMPARERREVQIIAVSVDPRGDTPASVAAFLAAHEMTGEMQYLLGSASALAQVWTRWGVGARRDTGNPELVAHTALIYGITSRGEIKTIYSSSFAPSDIVHDVPRLAAA
ncbi:MAG: SCO family protein [Solirubrobacteraceae bacterium]|jgi:protein SCO1/2